MFPSERKKASNFGKEVKNKVPIGERKFLSNVKRRKEKKP